MSCCFYRNHPPDPASSEALWGNARGCWEAFALLFGSALALVGEVFIRTDQRNEASAFLRGLESLVRRLLLIEATRLPRHPRGPVAAKRGSAPAFLRKPPSRYFSPRQGRNITSFILVTNT